MYTLYLHQKYMVELNFCFIQLLKNLRFFFFVFLLLFFGVGVGWGIAKALNQSKNSDLYLNRSILIIMAE